MDRIYSDRKKKKHECQVPNLSVSHGERVLLHKASFSAEARLGWGGAGRWESRAVLGRRRRIGMF